MSTLAEIEVAADTLPAEQQQELMRFLATRLHAADGALPPLRDLPRETMDQWIAEDEASFEQKVLEGLDGPVTPLSREDLDSARNLVRQARARQAA